MTREEKMMNSLKWLFGLAELGIAMALVVGWLYLLIAKFRTWSSAVKIKALSRGEAVSYYAALTFLYPTFAYFGIHEFGRIPPWNSIWAGDGAFGPFFGFLGMWALGGLALLGFALEVFTAKMRRR